MCAQDLLGETHTFLSFPPGAKKHSPPHELCQRGVLYKHRRAEDGMIWTLLGEWPQ